MRPLSPASRTRVVIVVLAAVTALVYGQTLRFDLVWDDILTNLTLNPWLNPPSWAHLAHFWTQPYAGMYIPVSYDLWGLLARLSQAVSGRRFDPAWFHAANVLVHGINGVLVYLLLRRLLASWHAALLGALVFLVHPLQVEAAAWVSELRGLLAAAFGLGALLLHLEVCRRRQASGPGATGLLYGFQLLLTALALLSKVSAAVIPFMGLVMEWALYRPRLGALLRRNLVWLLLPLPPLLLTAFTQGRATFLFASPQPLWAGPFVWGDSLWFYLSRVLVPVNLAAAYGRTPQVAMAGPLFYLAWLLPLGLAVLAWWLRRRPVPLLALAWFVIGFLPVSGLVPFLFQAWSTVADRYVYLGMTGVALAMGWLYQERAGPVRLLVVALVVFYAVWSSLVQVPVWRWELRLWDHALSVSPEVPRTYRNLGASRVRMGDWEQGVEDIDHAMWLYRRRSHPDDPGCGPRDAAGHYACVLDHLNWRLGLRTDASLYLLRAYVLLHLGRVRKAFESVARATGKRRADELARAMLDMGWGKRFGSLLEPYTRPARHIPSIPRPGGSDP